MAEGSGSEDAVQLRSSISSCDSSSRALAGIYKTKRNAQLMLNKKFSAISQYMHFSSKKKTYLCSVVHWSK